MMKKILLLILCLSFVSSAALKTWSAAADGTWATAGNWTPSGIPAAGDSVVFDATSVKNCSVAASTNALLALMINSTYTGTITVGDGQVILITNSHNNKGTVLLE
jgi:hypothetical protein